MCTELHSLMDQTSVLRLHMYMRKLKGVGNVEKYSLVHETNTHEPLRLIFSITCPTKHQWGRSALSLAAERDHVDVMKVLIEKGADVNTQDKVIMYRSLVTM